jgi:cysteine desulfurase
LIYLDYAATAPIRPAVRERLVQLLEQPMGNASSLHRQGHRARMALEEARETIASRLCAKVEEIVLTSGATEANNLALLGWARMQPAGSKVLVSAIEHPSVWDLGAVLRRLGYQVESIPVRPSGQLDLVALELMLTPETTLISVMGVSNEVGAIQPWAELADLRSRLAPRARIHVDAVQAGWLTTPPWRDPRIDLVSVSGHKLGGPVGSGCLVIRGGLVLEPLLRGGSQEDNRRAGTYNVLSAVGLARSLEETCQEQPKCLSELQASFEDEICQIEGATLLAASAPRSPHVSAWLFEGIPAEALLVRLDLGGVAASSGSACSSHSLEPSRTVLAMGYTPEQSKGLIRFSFGHATTAEELQKAAEVVRRSVAELRAKRGAREQ